MYSELPVDFFELRRALVKAAVFHRVGSLRDDTVLIEVRLPTSFWEIEFHADGTAEYEVFKSTGAILDGRGFIELVTQWWDQPLPRASLDRQLSERTVMRLLREAGICFSADEMLMRKIMVEGAVMIEVAVPGERWEIDVLATARSRWNASGPERACTISTARFCANCSQAPARRRRTGARACAARLGQAVIHRPI